MRVELASAGDCPVDGAVGAVVLAAREAMTNAAKFAGVEEIDVYAEVTDEEIVGLRPRPRRGLRPRRRAGRPPRASPSRSRAGSSAPAAARRS